MSTARDEPRDWDEDEAHEQRGERDAINAVMEDLESACAELRQTNDPHATLALDDVLGAIQALARGVSSLRAPQSARLRDGWDAAVRVILKGLASERDTDQRRAIEASVRMMLGDYTGMTQALLAGSGAETPPQPEMDQR